MNILVIFCKNHKKKQKMLNFYKIINKKGFKL